MDSWILGFAVFLDGPRVITRLIVDVAEMDDTNAKVEKVFAEESRSGLRSYTAVVDAAEDLKEKSWTMPSMSWDRNLCNLQAAEAHGANARSPHLSARPMADGQKPVGEEWEVDDRPDPGRYGHV